MDHVWEQAKREGRRVLVYNPSRYGHLDPDLPLAEQVVGLPAEVDDALPMASEYCPPASVYLIAPREVVFEQTDWSWT